MGPLMFEVGQERGDQHGSYTLACPVARPPGACILNCAQPLDIINKDCRRFGASNSVSGPASADGAMCYVGHMKFDVNKIRKAINKQDFPIGLTEGYSLRFEDVRLHKEEGKVFLQPMVAIKFLVYHNSRRVFAISPTMKRVGRYVSIIMNVVDRDNVSVEEIRESVRLVIGQAIDETYVNNLIAFFSGAEPGWSVDPDFVPVTDQPPSIFVN
jgi:hypothetical protein